LPHQPGRPSISSTATTDLLLADLGMPDEDGLSLIQKVRARELANGRARLPAIAVTGYASATNRDHALAAGNDQPVDPDELVSAIAKLFKADGV
jgi:CheY-like chemotaxis protein